MSPCREGADPGSSTTGAGTRPAPARAAYDTVPGAPEAPDFQPQHK
ncbi:hypothetical protein ACFXB3_25860 [Streptomyces sp. NPDC059447]